MTDSAGMPCATTLAPGAHFLSNVNGVANYTAPMRRCRAASPPWARAAAASSSRCCRSRTPSAPTTTTPPGGPGRRSKNEGFLRDDAYLLIVLITNEDDCSALGGAANRFSRAHPARTCSRRSGRRPDTGATPSDSLCGTPPAPPPIVSPIADDPGDFTTLVKLDDCVPSDGAGMLIPVSTIETALKALKADPASQDPDLRDRRSLPRQLPRDALRHKLEEVGVGRPERAVARDSALLRVGERRQLRLFRRSASGRWSTDSAPTGSRGRFVRTIWRRRSSPWSPGSAPSWGHLELIGGRG